MQDKNSSADVFTNTADDNAAEARVLGFLIAEHPAQVTEAEIVLALTGGSGVFHEGDAIERALVELIAGGLAHRHGDFIIPTRAARYSAGLRRG